MPCVTCVGVCIDGTHFALTPFCIACLAMLAERDMSSYELLVQLPINAVGYK